MVQRSRPLEADEISIVRTYVCVYLPRVASFSRHVQFSAPRILLISMRRPLQRCWLAVLPVVLSGGATSTLSGLTHLEGETVQVLGDGAVMPDFANIPFQSFCDEYWPTHLDLREPC